MKWLLPLLLCVASCGYHVAGHSSLLPETIHTIAIRARARVPRKELEAIVKGAIKVMVP